MNVLLRATISVRKRNTLVFALSVSYLSTTIHSAPSPRRPCTACDYLHPFEMIKTQARPVTNSLHLVSVVGRGALEKSRDSKRSFCIIKASLIKNTKKCSPDIKKTMELPLSFILKRSFRFVLEVKSHRPLAS